MHKDAHGYFLNSLDAMKADLWTERRKLSQRYETLEKQKHPCADAQWELMELNFKMMRLVDEARELAFQKETEST